MKFSCGKMFALISTFILFLSIAQPGKTNEESPVGTTNDNTTVPTQMEAPMSNTTVPTPSSDTPASNTTVPTPMEAPMSNTTVPTPSSDTPASNTTVPTPMEAPMSNTTVPTPSSDTPASNTTVPSSTDNNATDKMGTTPAPPPMKKPHKCILKKEILDKCASEGQICGELSSDKSVKLFTNTCELKVFNCQNRDFKLKYKTVDLAQCTTGTPQN